MMARRYCFLLAALMPVIPPGDETDAAEQSPVSIGAPIENLRFKDIRYLIRSLDDFESPKAIVIAAAAISSEKDDPDLSELKRLERQYRSHGVQFLLLYGAEDESIRDMAVHAINNDIPFPAVHDMDRECVRRLGLSRVSAVALLDAKRRLRYRGRVSDRAAGADQSDPADTEHLRPAIDAVLAGAAVTTPETSVEGKPIRTAERLELPLRLSYEEQIAPILRRHCTECHRDGTEAPFSLVSFADVTAVAGMISEVVADQRMPPWYAGSDHKEFINRRGMSRRERATIIEWVRRGTPRLPQAGGTAATAAIPPASEWEIGQPDLVLTMDETHELQPDGYVPYKYVVLPHVFTKETWVEAVQILPDNPAVVHHCNILMIPEDGSFANAVFLTGKVPGSGPTVADPGVGIRLPAGSSLGLQLHYTTTGKPEICRVSVGFRFPRSKVQQELKLLQMINSTFSIPPHASHHEVRVQGRLDCEATGLALFSHMHLRGKDMTFRARYPDGSSETLLMVPNYNFDWQMSYRWKTGSKRFPRGTEFDCIAHFDNSSFNPYNPDPTATVREGQQTFHEMMYGFLYYVDKNERLELLIDPQTGRIAQSR